MSAPLTPEQIEDIKAKAQALSQQLADAAMQSGDHELALNGLLAAYCAIAECHTCCTQLSANVLMACAIQLAQKAAQTRPQPGQKVH
jgi:hypothetical protein